MKRWQQLADEQKELDSKKQGQTDEAEDKNTDLKLTEVNHKVEDKDKVKDTTPAVKSEPAALRATEETRTESETSLFGVGDADDDSDGRQMLENSSDSLLTTADQNINSSTESGHRVSSDTHQTDTSTSS